MKQKVTSLQKEFAKKAMLFLSSMVLGCLSAFITLSIFLNTLNPSFRQQIFILLSSLLFYSIVFYLITEYTTNRLGVLRVFIMPSMNFQQMLRKTFLAVFFLFPMCLIGSQHLSEFFNILFLGKVYDLLGWMAPSEGARSFLLGAFIIISFMIWILFFFSSKSVYFQYLNTLPDYLYIILILFTGMVIRLFFIQLINTQPISDFAAINSDAILISKGLAPKNMYVSTHVITTIIYGYLYRIFGPDLVIIKGFHIVLYSVSGVFIYFAGKEIFGNRLWAGVAGFLVVTWPSLALYSNVLTPEHFFIFAECALVYCVSLFYRGLEDTPYRAGIMDGVFRIIIVGFFVGLMGMFRPFSQLFTAAFLLTFFISNPKPSLKMLTQSVVMVLFVWMLGNIPRVITDRYQNEFVNIRPCNLLVGMNIDAIGQINIEDQILCNELLLKTDDEAVVAKKISKFVYERLQEKQDYLIPFFYKKFEIVWKNSNVIVYWALQLPKYEELVSALPVAQKVNLIDFAIMFIVTLTCLAGAIIAFLTDMKPPIFFCLLAIFGFNMMEVFFEVQTRYRTVIMPLFIFFACWTFSIIVSFIQRESK